MEKEKRITGSRFHKKAVLRIQSYQDQRIRSNINLGLKRKGIYKQVLGFDQVIGCVANAAEAQYLSGRIHQLYT